MEVAVHESIEGSYLPPVFKTDSEGSLYPPQTIISEPVQTAVWPLLPKGAFVTEVAVHESLTGSYLPPVLKEDPPQIIISLPVQISVCPSRADGALEEEIDSH
jgi:hypothetical protein